ncbi:MAG: DUF2851 family protein [Balneola sp.]
MPDTGFSYSEEILQWIWEEQFFDSVNIRTTDSKSLEILNPGILNKSDGPDFKNAQIFINGVLWAGSVELHLDSKGWIQHGHHQDTAYNQVVLHVVAEQNPIEVLRKDGGRIPTFNILPYLPNELHQFVAKMNTSTDLPCSSGINYISEEAFLKQVQKAHHEYLEKKGNDVLRFYNPELPPSQAWKEALILSVFEAFGISHNRDSMLAVGTWYLKQEPDSNQKIIEDALEFAGFGVGASTLKWNYKGVFPASHPKKRIPQAINIASEIRSAPLEHFFTDNLKQFWSGFGARAGLSKSKSELLYGIVFIPAVYVLGQLFQHKKITRKVLEEWDAFKASIPSNLMKPFTSITEIQEKKYAGKLGLVHQYRAYCEPRRCHECFVLKKVISS